MLKKEIENYESQKGSLLEFRKELEKFVDEVCEKIIDPCDIVPEHMGRLLSDVMVREI